MRLAGGVLVHHGDQGAQSYDTFTCVHCGYLCHVKPGARPEDIGGYCRHCWNGKNPLSGLICPKCVVALDKADGICFPFQKMINDSTEREIERRRMKAGALKCY